jgi:outer membrane protein TolC
VWWLWIGGAQAMGLDEAWKLAESRSPDLEAATQMTVAADADVGLSRAAWLPKLALSGKYTFYDEPIELDVVSSLPLDTLSKYLPEQAIEAFQKINPVVVQDPSFFSASATVVVPLLDVDSWKQSHSAHLAQEAAMADEDAARRALRGGVAEAFYGTILAREALAVTDKALEIAQQQESIAKQRVAAGDVVARIGLEAEAARLAAERERAVAAEQVTKAETALQRWAGIAPGTPLERGPVEDVSLDSVRSASDSYPRVVAARSRADAAHSQVTSADLAWVPDVNGTVTGLVTQNEAFDDDPYIVTGTVEATWMWDGGAKSALAKKARAERAAAEAQVESERLALTEEIDTTWAALERAKASNAAAEKEEAVSVEVLKQAQLAFDQGALPFIELDRALLRARAARLAHIREDIGVALVTTQLELLQ